MGIAQAIENPLINRLLAFEVQALVQQVQYK